MASNHPIESIVKYGYEDYIDMVMKVAWLIRRYVFDATERGELPLYYIKPIDANRLEYLPESYVLVEIYLNR